MAKVYDMTALVQPGHLLQHRNRSAVQDLILRDLFNSRNSC